MKIGAALSALWVCLSLAMPDVDGASAFTCVCGGRITFCHSGAWQPVRETPHGPLCHLQCYINRDDTLSESALLFVRECDNLKLRSMAGDSTLSSAPSGLSVMYFDSGSLCVSRSPARIHDVYRRLLPYAGAACLQPATPTTEHAVWAAAALLRPMSDEVLCRMTQLPGASSKECCAQAIELSRRLQRNSFADAEHKADMEKTLRTLIEQSALASGSPAELCALLEALSVTDITLFALVVPLAEYPPFARLEEFIVNHFAAHKSASKSITALRIAMATDYSQNKYTAEQISGLLKSVLFYPAINNGAGAIDI